MVYRKINFQEEIDTLKKWRICAWSGYEQKHLIVTVENREGEKSNRRYYFTDKKEYSKFLKHLRKLEQ